MMAEGWKIVAQEFAAFRCGKFLIVSMHNLQVMLRRIVDPCR
jgi:hypothetical protein